MIIKGKTAMQKISSRQRNVDRICNEFLRWSLILIFLFFGYSKWFEYEAQALIPIISNSPILGWMHTVFGISGASYALGIAEWGIAALLIAGAQWNFLAKLGALGSVLTFATTVTLIFSTPGAWEASAGGFPAMGEATSFLLKDVVLLAASLMLLKAAFSDDNKCSRKPN